MNNETQININIEKLKQIILNNLENKNEELKRVFHGRGNAYDDYNYLVVDSINDILLATLFVQVDEGIEKDLVNLLDEIYATKKFKTLVIQRRYKKDNLNEIRRGKVPLNAMAIENGLKYKIRKLVLAF